MGRSFTRYVLDMDALFKSLRAAGLSSIPEDEKVISGVITGNKVELICESSDPELMMPFGGLPSCKFLSY